MKNISTIIKKELYRFFSDKRLLFTTILLPGIMIYVLYSFMGKMMHEREDVDEDYRVLAYVVHMPEDFGTAMENLHIELQEHTLLDMDEMKRDVEEKNVDLLLVFPEDFMSQVLAYDSQTAITKAPQVQIYYNSANNASYNAYTACNAMLAEFESSMVNKFDVNVNPDDTYDLASDKDMTSKIFSALVPMLLISCIFSACIATAPESIAGEKERGTLMTILVTPVKRSELAIGKIIALSFLALLSGTSSFLGTALSLPKLMNGSGDEEFVNTNVYSIRDYLVLFLIVACTVLLIIAMIAVISAFAKNVKEAGSYASPIMILAMVISITSMLGDTAKEAYLYLIPVYNSVQCMTSVFQFSVNGLHVALTIVSNVIYAGLFVFLLTKMFDSEKMMQS